MRERIFMQQVLLFSCVKANEIKAEVDGHLYAKIKHRLVSSKGLAIQVSTKPRMLRFNEPSFKLFDEAYVWFATVGVETFKALEPLPGGVMAKVVDGRAGGAV